MSILIWIGGGPNARAQQLEDVVHDVEDALPDDFYICGAAFNGRDGIRCSVPGEAGSELLSSMLSALESSPSGQLTLMTAIFRGDDGKTVECEFRRPVDNN
jgi:hypothetical protein